jgi:Cu+-exporting ATPase
MTIAPENAVGHIEHEGKRYHFCSSSCLEKFRADPKRYSKAHGQPKEGNGSRGVGHTPDASGGTRERINHHGFANPH